MAPLTKRLLMQEMVDNIPEDKKWECPECASVKIERRKVAVEPPCGSLEACCSGQSPPQVSNTMLFSFSYITTCITVNKMCTEAQTCLPQQQNKQILTLDQFLIPAW